MESVEYMYATNVDIRVYDIYVDSKFLLTSKIITRQGPMHQLLKLTSKVLHKYTFKKCVCAMLDFRRASCIM